MEPEEIANVALKLEALGYNIAIIIIVFVAWMVCRAATDPRSKMKYIIPLIIGFGLSLLSFLKLVFITETQIPWYDYDLLIMIAGPCLGTVPGILIDLFKPSKKFSDPKYNRRKK